AATLRWQDASRIPQDFLGGPAAAPAASTPGQVRVGHDDLWTSEGLQGICQNQLTPAVVRRTAEAFAAELLVRAGTERPRVVLAGDGRPLTAELLAAAGEGLRWSGCDVFEIGTTCLPVA